MILKKYLLDLKNNKKFSQCSQAFIDRIHFAYSLLTQSSEFSLVRKISVPHALNDLGVRIDHSAKLLIDLNVACMNSILPNDDDILSELRNVPIQNLATYLDVVFLSTGNYELLLKIVIERKEEILTNGDFNVLIYAGNIVSKSDLDLAILFFDTASGRASTQLRSLTASQRAIVVCIKRKQDYMEARRRFRQILNTKVENIIDQFVILALLDNLYSLQLIMEEKTDFSLFSSELILFNAMVFSHTIFLSDANDEIKDQAMRYRSQMSINYAQLLQKRGDYTKAVELLGNNLKEVEKHAPNYYAEGLGALAYSLYSNKSYDKAIFYAHQAIVEYIKVGALLAMRSLREVLIGSYEKSGQHEKALKIAQLMIDDPLGKKMGIC